MSQIKVITPNAGQAAAIEELLAFATAPYVADPFYVFEGPAGTGKSFCLTKVQEPFLTSAGTLAFTATTNKAAKVVRALVGKATTIYSLLGLRIQANGELKELSDAAEHIDLSGIDCVVVDEAGMIPNRLMTVMRQAAVRHNLRFILVADRYQLPPVGEKESVIWRLPQVVSLTKVMRHDNQILELVTRIRLAMDQPIMNIDIRSNNDGKEGVWEVGKADFKQRIYSDAEAGAFGDTTKTKIIAWRNVKTAEYNALVRRAIFGPAAGVYEIGERIIAAAPCIVGDEVALGTDEEAIVEGIIEARHPLSPEFETIELKCRTEDNRIVRLRTLHPRSVQAHANAVQSAAHAAKQDGKKWKAFWNLKELFHEVKYAYAITAHRAQGSTYENVYVDYQDILLNRERREAFQCLYVGCSRPTTKLILV